MLERLEFLLYYVIFVHFYLFLVKKREICKPNFEYLVRSEIAPRYIISHCLPITSEIDIWNHWNCKTAAGVYSLEYTSTSYGLPLIYEFDT